MQTSNSWLLLARTTRTSFWSSLRRGALISTIKTGMYPVLDRSLLLLNVHQTRQYGCVSYKDLAAFTSA